MVLVVVVVAARGGCFIEGQRLKNAFRWKDSVGPWEQRPGHFGDVWSYWTDDALGYFEALQVSAILMKLIQALSNLLCKAILLAQTAITRAAKRPGAPSPDGELLCAYALKCAPQRIPSLVDIPRHP
ncbi:hypothetical protein PIB30_077703 [Stylosanthes scabra]|uniref:Alpha-L-arabinofuranosidase 1 catalytic domain-containing protein n=1 Tax=Stylosanthes scabra TaxID=79078 RepID=A0ABU6ZPA0_9FABA|nr:hypothetical protein [Stylosanthes scabra]